VTTLDVLGRPVRTGRRVLFHEHIQFGWPGFNLDYLSRRTDPDRAVRFLDELNQAGYGVVVDATTLECGRDLLLLREIAQRTDVQLVASTGIYHARRGFPDHLASLSVEELADLFEHDLLPPDGAPPAGVVKVAAERLPLAKREQKAIRAAGQVSAKLGTSVVCHSVHASVASEILEIFQSEGGPPPSIVLGHLDNERPHFDELASLAAVGAFIGIDRFGAGGDAADAERVELVGALRDRGLLSSVLVSHDRPLTFLGRVSTDFGPDNLFLHIERNILPALKRRGLGNDEIETLLIDNPLRFLKAAGSGVLSESAAREHASR